MMRAPGLAAPRTKTPRSAAVADGSTGTRALPAMKRLFLMPSPLAQRGRDCFDRDRHQALIRIGEAAAPALGLAAATIIALIDLDQALAWRFRPPAQHVAQLVRHQPGRVGAHGTFADKP